VGLDSEFIMPEDRIIPKRLIAVSVAEKFKKKKCFQTLDTKGRVLQAGEEYLLNGRKVTVLREEFGSGQILDTYHRVFYLDTNNREHFAVVKGLFVPGSTARTKYKSNFSPILE
jgi:hypothetical protein